MTLLAITSNSVEILQDVADLLANNG